jgi:sterol desaturase/sphingolipid hydroxylase (fatty acid hydroxylase superfamily)
VIGVSFAVGAVGWSFAEYFLHNVGGHVARGRTRFSREHLQHHAERLYFTPWQAKVAIAVPQVAIVTSLAVFAAGWADGVAFAVGFLGAWLTYEVLHRRLHTHPPTGAYGRWARKHHFAHHFTAPHLNHGVTSPIWDLVFRTHLPVEQVRVPPKMAMPWLVDPATGEVFEAYAGDYALARRRGARREAAGSPVAQPVV